MSGERAADAEDVRRGQRLAAMREAAGFARQLDLAVVADVLPPDVSRVESGKNRFTGPSIRNGYAAAFGVSAETIDAYVAGVITLDEVKARWSPKPAAAGPALVRPPGSAVARAVAAPDPYPNRTAAVILLRQKGYPEGVLDALRSMSFKGAEDFGILDFVQKGKEVLDVFNGIEPVEPAVPPHPDEDPEAPPTEEQIRAQAALLPKRRKRST